MKKLFFLVIATIGMLASCCFIGCNKDAVNPPVKSLQMNKELAALYENVPTFDFGNITLINGEILRFENVAHYEKVYDILLRQYEAWSDIFFERYDTDNEDALDSIIDQLGFDDCMPLLLFEERYGILDNNLRAIWVEHENVWLDKGAVGPLPVDEIVSCPREQTLYSKYHEVCIGDTIYQMRADGRQVLIPIAEIEHLPEIRAAVTESDFNQFPRVVVIPKAATNACYQSEHYNNGKQDHPESGEKYFTWTYSYGKALSGHKYKTVVTMKNYKKKNGKWKKDDAVCALGLKTKLYSYMTTDESCSAGGDDYADLNTPHKHYSLTKTKYTRQVQTVPGYSSTTIGPFTITSKIEIEGLRIDPSESWIQCRHQGWTYQFNAATGNPE